MDIFQNTHEALTFAFRYSGQQYALSPMAKMMKTGVLPSGKGLVSVDGAGQAGLILAAVDRLGAIDPGYKACIVARYSERFKTCPCCTNPEMMLPEYAMAVSVLENAVARNGVLTGMTIGAMRQVIVRSFYEKKIKVNKEAERLRVPPRTAYDQRTKVWTWLKKLDQEAQARIDAMLMPADNEKALPSAKNTCTA